MNDLEKLTKLLQEFGVVYELLGESVSLNVDNEPNSKVCGYSGFVASFTFDNGKFTKVNIWE